MKERPILFSGPMVRALLDGRKTQTRRVVKWPGDAEPDMIEAHEELPGEFAPWLNGERLHTIECPYGVPSDRLWVKESGLHKRGPLFELFIHDATPDRYWASPDHGGEKLTPEVRGRRGAGIGPALTRDQHKGMGFKARPSIHMPRWASRLTLEITDVRVERLQDISEADAEAEGAEYGYGEGAAISQRRMFELLWTSIHGLNSPYSWAANPWVWALTFRVLP